VDQEKLRLKKIKEDIEKKNHQQEMIRQRQIRREKQANRPIVGNLSTHFCFSKATFVSVLLFWIGSFVYMMRACKIYSEGKIPTRELSSI
jgi:hypothetical protein